MSQSTKDSTARVITNAKLKVKEGVVDINSSEIPDCNLEGMNEQCDEIAKVASCIVSAFLSLHRDNNYQRGEIIEICDSLIEKLAKIRKKLHIVTNSFIAGIKKIKGVSSSKPVNIRDADEPFDEAIRPCKEILKARDNKHGETTLAKLESIINCVKREVIAVKRKESSTIMTDAELEEWFDTSQKDTDMFKTKVLEALKRVILWILVSDVSIYCKMAETRENCIKRLRKGMSTENNNEKDDYDELNMFETCEDYDDIQPITGKRRHGEPTTYGKRRHYEPTTTRKRKHDSEEDDSEEDEPKTNTENKINNVQAYGRVDKDHRRRQSSELDDDDDDDESDDAIRKLKNSIDNTSKYAQYIKTNITNGSYVTCDSRFNLMGGKQDPTRSKGIERLESARQPTQQEVIDVIHTLNAYVTELTTDNFKFARLKKQIMEMFNKDVSIYVLMQDYTKYLICSCDINKQLHFVTRDTVQYYKIALNKIRSNARFSSQFREYMPAIQHVLVSIESWFKDESSSPENANVDEEIEYFEKVTSRPCKAVNPNRYFNVCEQPANVKFDVIILDALECLVLAPFRESSQTVITPFCIINNYRNSEADGHIYKRITDKDAYQYIETIDPRYCPSSTLMPMTTPGVDVPLEFKTARDNTMRIPFAYIFDRCELSMLPRWVRIKEDLETKNVVMQMYGVSGSGKSFSLLGDQKIVNGTPTYVDGVLQYALREINQPFKLEVLEIYGRALPFYESFNSDDASKPGLLKTISWIKEYTKNKKFQDTGKYDSREDTEDAYKEDEFAYTSSEKNGALIKTPQKIHEYFEKRLSEEHIREMYHVPADKTQQYLREFSANIVEPIKRKRQQLRTVNYTANNAESSRSVLMYTFLFEKPNGKYACWLIHDSPGVEHPITTYVYDKRRNTEEVKADVVKSYDGVRSLSQNEIDLHLKKFTQVVPNRETFFTLMILNPLLLIGIDPKYNTMMIKAINDHIDKIIEKGSTKEEKDKIKNELRKVVKNVAEEVINEKGLTVEKDLTRLTMEQVLKNNLMKESSGTEYKYQFPQIYDWYHTPGTIVNNLKLPLTKPKSSASPEVVEMFNILTDETSTLRHASYSDEGKKELQPNIYRELYITFIIKNVLKSPLFNHNSIIEIILSTLASCLKLVQDQTPYGKQGELANALNRLFKIDTDDLKIQYICNRINNSFEAYFINELNNLMIRDMTEFVSQIPDETYDKKMYQGDRLQVKKQGAYILKRLCSIGRENPLVGDIGVTRNVLEASIGKDILEYNPITQIDVGFRGGLDSDKNLIIVNRLLTVNSLIETPYMEVDEHATIDIVQSDTRDVREEKANAKKLQEAKKSILKEIDASYSYSKCISKKGQNNIFDILKVRRGDMLDNREMAIYPSIVLSSVQSGQKCITSGTLYQALSPMLKCIARSENCNDMSTGDVMEDTTVTVSSP